MYGISPRPASSAYVYILAGTAFPFIFLKIPHVLKQRGILPYVLKGLLSYIAGRFREVAAGNAIPVNIDKAYQLTCQASLGAAR